MHQKWWLYSENYFLVYKKVSRDLVSGHRWKSFKYDKLSTHNRMNFIVAAMREISVQD